MLVYQRVIYPDIADIYLIQVGNDSMVIFHSYLCMFTRPGTQIHRQGCHWKMIACNASNFGRLGDQREPNGGPVNLKNGLLQKRMIDVMCIYIYIDMTMYTHIYIYIHNNHAYSLVYNLTAHGHFGVSVLSVDSRACFISMFVLSDESVVTTS